MRLTLDESDLEALYHALGCLSPQNDAHKPLAILIARLEVQRTRVPLVRQPEYLTDDDYVPQVAAQFGPGITQSALDAIEREKRTPSDGTAASEFKGQARVTVELEPPPGIKPIPASEPVGEITDFTAELDLLKRTLDEREYELVCRIYERTLFVPLVKIIRREGRGGAGHVVGVNVTYGYVDINGNEVTKTVHKEDGRASEMVLHALREAVMRVNHDHYPRTT